MGRTSTVPQAVKMLHAALIAAGYEDQIVPRDMIVKMICQRYDISADGARRYVDTGRVLGLWEALHPLAREQAHSVPSGRFQEARLRILAREPDAPDVPRVVPHAARSVV